VTHSVRVNEMGKGALLGALNEDFVRRYLKIVKFKITTLLYSFVITLYYNNNNNNQVFYSNQVRVA
jgi:hypothetical protein